MTTSTKPKPQTKQPFKQVTPLNKLDFPKMERALLRRWTQRDIMAKYLRRNEHATERFKFIDGPITANNKMGVHHAWNRAYKDMYQRFNTMLGKKQRYQNGYDCQGLWVEVEVEKEKGFKSKRDIEEFGIDNFVNACKARVQTFANIITEQSKRLGYWTNWDNSYFTMSEENNYTIWKFLQVCNERGLIYKGRDSMPWCPRCATGISDMEINEGRKTVQHTSVFVRFALKQRPNEYLLVWTTTPWTLPANVACAVNPDLQYARVEQDGSVYYLCKDLVPKLEKLRGHTKGAFTVTDELPGSAMVGWEYEGPFDDLPAWSEKPFYAAGVTPKENPYTHYVVAWSEVAATEGTGIVHIAPGCGREDFYLGKDEGLRLLAPIDESGEYTAEYGWLAGKFVNDVRREIFDALKAKELFYTTEVTTHVYPHCWRCGTELVFRNVEEWFISMGPHNNPERKGLRYEIMDVVSSIRWIPDFGLEREMDWLRNMEDWMISKKRYWGLALPIYECSACHTFEIIGSESELKNRAVEGWEFFEGHTPHRPWIDAVKIACPHCGAVCERIKDVGNPWLDAGIVPYSTLHYRDNPEYWNDWFPANFITESFPGQFRNWFYSMLVMSIVLEHRAPFETVLGFASVLSDKGKPMHKSDGTAVWFDEASERIGSDTLRWLFMSQNPEQDVWFPLLPTMDEMSDAQKTKKPVRLNDKWMQVRSSLDKIWNVYYFFVTYANIDQFAPGKLVVQPDHLTEVDRWILAELQETIREVTDGLTVFDSRRATIALSDFIEQLSNWYVRRVRRRIWKNGLDYDKAAAYETMYTALLTISQLIAPITPFIAEEMYLNLTRSHKKPEIHESVHLADWPKVNDLYVNQSLREEIRLAQRVVNLGRSARETAKKRVRQPLQAIYVRIDESKRARLLDLSEQILEELNIKELKFLDADSAMLQAQVKPNMAALGQKYRQQMRGILEALKSADGAAAMKLYTEGRLPIHLPDGAALELNTDEVSVGFTAREGFIAAEDNGLVAALDITLTPELEAEGLARDLSHYINSARKNADLAIEDTIDTTLAVDDAFKALLGKYTEYICEETLTKKLKFIRLGAKAPVADYTETFAADRLDGHETVVYITRVAESGK